MSRTKKSIPERIEKVTLKRIEGMWIAPAAAMEAAERAYEEATVGKLMNAIDAFLDVCAKQ